MSDINRQNSCSQKPCQSRPFERPDGTSQEDVNAELRGRPVLYTGVIWIGLLRRFLIPRTCGSSMPPMVPSQASSSRPADKPVAKSVSHVSVGDSNHKMLRPQPSAPALLSNKRPKDNEKDEDTEANELRRRQKKEDRHSPLAALVMQIQEASAVATDQARQLSSDLGDIVREGTTTTTDTIQTMRKEDGVVYRYGAISVSGLVGYLMGIRRGAVTRLVYCATGATAMATLCYPKEAQKYNTQGLAFIKRCIVLGVELVQEGPQRVLGKADSTESKKSDSDSQDLTQTSEAQQTYQPSQTVPNNVTTPKKNYGTLHHHHEQFNKKKTNTAIQTPAVPRHELKNLNDSVSSTVVPPAEPPCTKEHQSTQPPRQGRKLSLQCQTDVTKSLPDNKVPYSPALPSPPKMKSNYNEQSFGDSVNTPIQAVLDEPKVSTQKTNPSLHSYSINDSFGVPETNTGKKVSEPAMKESAINNVELRFGLIPTPEPIVITEEEHATYGNEHLSKNEQYPLNKKLSRFYEKSEDVKKSEKTTCASSGKAHEDHCAKRE